MQRKRGIKRKLDNKAKQLSVGCKREKGESPVNCGESKHTVESRAQADGIDGIMGMFLTS